MKELTSDFGPLILMIIMTTMMGISMIVMSTLLGRSRPHKRKLDTFECGMPLLDTMKKRISMKFFIVAVLFIVFDVEVAFLFPWALINRGAELYMFVAVNIFIAFLALIFIYLWKEGAFTWEK